MDKKVKSIYFYVISILITAVLIFSGDLKAAVIIDHTSVQDFENIPSEHLNLAKENLRIGYQHTSHGSQLVTGMEMLKTENSSLYSYTYTSYQSRSSSTDAFLSDYCMYDYGAYDLGQPDRTDWVDATRDYLESNGSNRNVIIWAWCYHVAWATESQIADLYLANMNALEAEFPDVVFVYMTGHLDGSDSSYLKERNQQIRDYVNANDKILYDFADIESYDPDGAYYPDGSDACEWCETWCETHTCPSCGECAHSHCFNCYNKGKAFWYMMAALIGDDDNDGIPDVVEDPNHNDAVDEGETNPHNIDTDGDGILDGTESGYTLDDIGPDTDTNIFQPDLDPTTTTDPTDPDTDNDGATDGEEDIDHNGRVDEGETDPNTYNAPAAEEEEFPWVLFYPAFTKK